MGLLLAFSCLVTFCIAFAVAALVLRVPADERVMERRLESSLPTARAAVGASLDSVLEKSSAASKGTAWTGRLKPLRELETLVYQGTGKRSIGPVLMTTGAAAVVGFAAVEAVTSMMPVAALAGVLLGALPIGYYYRLRQKRLKAFEASLPDCIDMCARALRAGHSLVAAIGIVAEQASGPAQAEFADVFKKQNYGLPLRDALLEMLERVPSADLRVFATGIFVQKDTGGNLAEIFDRIVHVVRERIRIQGEIRVHTAQGRMTAWILSLLPPGLFLVVNLIDPGYSTPMFHEDLGRKLMYAGIVLLLMGGLVVRRIVNGIEV